MKFLTVSLNANVLRDLWLRCVVLSAMYGGSSMDMAPPPPTYQNPSTLEALLPTVVNTEQANRLFDLMPGLEFCSYDQPTGLLSLVTFSLIIIIIIIHRQFLTRRNTTKSLQGRASTQWLMTCHTKIVVFRHISVRSCQW